MEPKVEQFLKHHGVRGMRWGVRKSRSSSVKVSTDHRKTHDLKDKGAPSLSNKQLKAVNERLSMEQNFSRMTEKKGKILTGKQKAELILGTVGVGVTAYNTITSKAGQAAIKKGKFFLDAMGKSSHTPLHFAK